MSAPICSVCLEALSDRPEPSILECGHAFCGGCIRKFELSSRPHLPQCPKCKKVFRPGTARRMYLDYEQEHGDESNVPCATRKVLTLARNLLRGPTVEVQARAAWWINKLNHLGDLDNTEARGLIDQAHTWLISMVAPEAMENFAVVFLSTCKMAREKLDAAEIERLIQVERRPKDEVTVGRAMQGATLRQEGKKWDNIRGVHYRQSLQIAHLQRVLPGHSGELGMMSHQLDSDRRTAERLERNSNERGVTLDRLGVEAEVQAANSGCIVKLLKEIARLLREWAMTIHHDTTFRGTKVFSKATLLAVLVFYGTAQIWLFPDASARLFWAALHLILQFLTSLGLLALRILIVLTPLLGL